MRCYTTAKLDQLSVLEAPEDGPVLAYLLQETWEQHELLGVPRDYQVLTVPAPSPSSHEGLALLLHPAARLRWSKAMASALAATVDWGGLQIHLVVTYVPPMTAPHRARLEEGGLLPRAADALVEVDALLGLLPCGEEPVILMGDLNARIGDRVPPTPDHPLRASPDATVDARGRALLELAGRHGLFVVNGVTPETSHATRPLPPSGAGPGVPGASPGRGDCVSAAAPSTAAPVGLPCVGGSTSGGGSSGASGPGRDPVGGTGCGLPPLTPGTVLDYCLVSRAAYDLIAGARVGGPLDGSDHVPLHLALRAPTPSRSRPPPREFTMRWEPGTEGVWTARVDCDSFCAAAQAALSIPDPSAASEAFEELCIGACRDVGILRRPKAHNPNQDGKHLAEWFDAACRAAKQAEQ